MESEDEWRGWGHMPPVPSLKSAPADILQKGLDEISNWACKWQLKFNVSKCVLLQVTRSDSQLTNSPLIINNTDVIHIVSPQIFHPIV